MSDNEKLSRDAKTLVVTDGKGEKYSIQHTEAGTRVNKHEGGTTTPVPPESLGIESTSTSNPGGRAARLTVTKTDGTAEDYTRAADGAVDKVIHKDDKSEPVEPEPAKKQ